MSKKIALSFVFLFSLMTICQSAFAQFKVDDYIDQLDRLDRQMMMAMNQDNGYENFGREVLEDGFDLINFGRAYIDLSSADKSAYVAFRDAYENYKDSRALSVFSKFSNEQIDRVARAIAEDNPELKSMFENYGVGFGSNQKKAQTSNRKSSKVNPEPRRENQVVINLGKAYSNLSQDDKKLYSEFKNVYQKKHDLSFLKVFDGKKMSQVMRVANAIVDDNQNLKGLFEKNGLLSIEGLDDIKSKQGNSNINNNNTSINNNNSASSDQNVDSNGIPHAAYSTYNLLTETEKYIYDSIYYALANAESSVTLKNGDMIDNIDNDAISNAVRAVRLDHIEFVWLDNHVFKQYSKWANTIEIQFQYNELADNPRLRQREFEDAANQLLSWARQEKSLLDMEKYIFGYLKIYVKYGHNDLDQTGYGALVNKECVCGGFAVTFHYLMTKLGIPSYYVLGYTEDGGYHAWNAIKLDGKWYNVDSTPNTSNSYTQNTDDKYFNRPWGGEFWAEPDYTDFPVSRFK